MFFLSRRAIRPAVESLKKQKQFITDAGHEIKTPLSIIAANADVLELSAGGSEWLDSIRHQVKRLDGLAADLLTLSKLEEEDRRAAYRTFSLSEAAAETAEPFAIPAAAKGKTLECRIQPGIVYCGDEAAIRRLISILLDNAVKYAAEGGTILLTLAAAGKNVRLEVTNPCDQLPQGDLDRLFDRFYRPEASRSRETGGTGIGLSIARAVVQAHGGKITADRPQEGVIRFTANF